MVDLPQPRIQSLKDQDPAQKRATQIVHFGDSFDSTEHLPDDLRSLDVTSKTWNITLAIINGCECLSASLTLDSTGKATFFFETTSSDINNYYYIGAVTPFDQNGQSLSAFSNALGNFGVNRTATPAQYIFTIKVQFCYGFIYPYMNTFTLAYGARLQTQSGGLSC